MMQARGRDEGTSLARVPVMMSKLKNLWRMAAGPVRERGWVETVRSVRCVLRDRQQERVAPFDADFGTDTERSVTIADLDATGADVPALWRYWPTSRDSFRAVMRDVEVHRDGLRAEPSSKEGHCCRSGHDRERR